MSRGCPRERHVAFNTPGMLLSTCMPNLHADPAPFSPGEPAAAVGAASEAGLPVQVQLWLQPSGPSPMTAQLVIDYVDLL